MRKIMISIVASVMIMNVMTFSYFSAYADEASTDDAAYADEMLIDDVDAAAVTTETNENDEPVEYSELFNIKVVCNTLGDDYGNYISGMQMHLERQAIEWIDEDHYRLVGERENVVDWNTSDSNPFFTGMLTTDKEVLYFVTSENMADGYAFYGKDKVELAVEGLGDGEPSNVDVGLQHKTYDIRDDVPLTGTYSLTLRVADIVSDANIEDLDCELYNRVTGEVVRSWNTSEEPTVTVENLEYAFDSKDSITGNIRYSIRITNLPEKYVFFFGKRRDSYGVSGFGLEEFAYGSDCSSTVYLEDTSEDAPKVTYLTGALTTAAGMTTTTTTTSEAAESTSDDATAMTEETTITTAPQSTDSDVPETTSYVTGSKSVASADTSTTTTTTTTTDPDESEELPQTGYPFSTNDIMAGAVSFILIGSGMTGFSYLKKKR
jgi:hypothetical protein